MLELAIILPIVLMVLFVAIQLAILGNAALSVTQLSYTGSRYAAVNPTYDLGKVKAYMVSAGSPAITEGSGRRICRSP